MNQGTPNVRQILRRAEATPCASFDGNDYAKRSFDALCRYQLLMCSEISVSPIPTPSIVPGTQPGTWLCAGFVTAFCACTRMATLDPAYSYTFLASGRCLVAATAFEPPLGGHAGSLLKRSGPTLGSAG